MRFCYAIYIPPLSFEDQLYVGHMSRIPRQFSPKVQPAGFTIARRCVGWTSSLWPVTRQMCGQKPG